jgi:hypothetical protein
VKTRYRTGDAVRVRTAEQILATLDGDGRFDGMPFMPEMLAYCGHTFRVSAVAHKTCDTVGKTGGRWLPGTVHLGNLRCSGAAHGGCDAHCLLFWKEVWLEPAESTAVTQCHAVSDEAPTSHPRLPVTRQSGRGTVYSCQATELPRFTTRLPWWDLRQYVMDVRTGNRTLRAVLSLGLLKLVQNAFESGVGHRFFLRLYNFLQRYLGGVPRVTDERGPIGKGKRTPTETLDLQPGELVEVKSYEEIRQTLDEHAKNRGMRFDVEMKPYCGQRLRVTKRVEQILDEQTGELVRMKVPSVLLEGGVCQSRFSHNRMFCPRQLPGFWREIWLRRVEPSARPVDRIATLQVVD